MTFKKYKEKIHITIGKNKKLTFIPVAKIDEPNRSLIFSIIKEDNDQYVLRGFWKSRSTSHWRAFIGVKYKEEGFKKNLQLGRESHACYIHETMVLPELNDKLEEFSINNVSKNLSSNQTKTLLMAKNLKKLESIYNLPKDSMQKYANFKDSKNPKHSTKYLNQFAIEYNQTRKRAITTKLKNFSDKKKYISNIEIQQSRFKMPNELKSFSDYLIKKLKCVSDKDIRKLGYQGENFTHTLTKDKFKQLLFKVELERENSSGNKQKDHLIIVFAIKVQGLGLYNGECYVRQVYWEDSSINNFGVRSEIPSDLSFLIQKPCDYKHQVSKEYRGRDVGNHYSCLLQFDKTASFNQGLIQSIYSTNVSINNCFLECLLDKASTKVKNRKLSLGLAGKKVSNVGTNSKSFIVQTNLANAVILVNIPMILKYDPKVFKLLFIEALQVLNISTDKNKSSRDDAIQKLYIGANTFQLKGKSDPNSIFKNFLEDEENKKIQKNESYQN
ncbi:MAG: hypothetical protein EP298_05410 [Gammaproteobacteria bacterium]|nr:MAG: hypothetical protein EP298_05410 [Gammaproteobacteria bacterium]UTW43234.1 hypothetical protein KFE69_03570 [bacterium SCSIO 12844]